MLFISWYCYDYYFGGHVSGPTVTAALRSLPARTPGVQISGFTSLIVTCCSIFANAEKKSVSGPQEISLLQSFFVLPEIEVEGPGRG